jgi:hypothetical protein
MPGVAASPIGAAGAWAGVIAIELAEAGPLPAALVATTEKEYAVPFVKPITVAVVMLPSAVVTLKPPGFEVTV